MSLIHNINDIHLVLFGRRRIKVKNKKDFSKLIKVKIV